MRTLIQRPKQVRQRVPFGLPVASHQKAKSDEVGAPSNSSKAARFSHDFSRIPVHASSPVNIQTKLAVSSSADPHEVEADRVAEELMRLPESNGHEPLRVSRVGTSSFGQRVSPVIHEALTSPGQPLHAASRTFMEKRFGLDFSQVRVHADDKAATAARAIQARAFTLGHDIVFGGAEYSPRSVSGQRLLAHELTHVVQQEGGARCIQRAPDPAAEAAKKAAKLETEILADPVYKKLPTDSRTQVGWIIGQAKKKPFGDAPGQCNYYLAKLKDAITTPSNATGKGYGCSGEIEKTNKKAVEKALRIEAIWGGAYSDVDEKAVASGANKVRRIGEGGKSFLVDRSDPRNIRVQIKVKLNGKPDESASIKKLEDAIEREVSMGTKGYYLDLVFVDKSGSDVFEFSVTFCEWPNSGNWASSPVVLSHEVHHALGLADRYDYIEAHAKNPDMTVEMRLVWFSKQMSKAGESARDPHSKMGRGENPLLAEDVCAVAFPPGPDRKKCVNARKDLDPAGTPPLPP